MEKYSKTEKVFVCERQATMNNSSEERLIEYGEEIVEHLARNATYKTQMEALITENNASFYIRIKKKR